MLMNSHTERNSFSPPLSINRNINMSSPTYSCQTSEISSHENAIPRAHTSSLTNVLPSNQPIVTGTTAAPHLPLPGSNTTAQNLTGIEVGPGPARHPKPLTAADLYAQLEKEQEAVVNRLTRELSLLRSAQNASVVSNASSTSTTGYLDGSECNTANQNHSGFPQTTNSRFNRHRSSSGNSVRSAATTNPIPISQGTTASRPNGRAGLGRSDGVTGLGLSGVIPNTGRHEAWARWNTSTPSYSGPISPMPGSRYTAFSEESSPNLSQSHSSQTFPQRDVISRGPNHTPAGGERELQLGSRFEEIAQNRMELENVKKENEILKRKVRELEALITKKKKGGTAVSPTGKDSEG
ncbi:unnamed protein product [Blumeria hordei]|uniref:Uncharacterized protein n=1 Tax=Blumeria hordei TaxID=2867405 RepID=A0A383UKM1_BLUHO|nr:unnamed protein product [Blumeria hordei]